MERTLNIENLKECVEDIRSDHGGRYYVQSEPNCSSHSRERSIDAWNVPATHGTWNWRISERSRSTTRVYRPPKTRSQWSSTMSTWTSTRNRPSPPLLKERIPLEDTGNRTRRIAFRSPASTESQKTRLFKTAPPGMDTEQELESLRFEDSPRAIVWRSQDRVCHLGLHGIAHPPVRAVLQCTTRNHLIYHFIHIHPCLAFLFGPLEQCLLHPMYRCTPDLSKKEL